MIVKNWSLIPNEYLNIGIIELFLAMFNLKFKIFGILKFHDF